MSARLRSVTWWYWLVTGLLLVGSMARVRGAFAVTVILTVMQGVHVAQRAQDPTALSVQVRLLFLLVLLAGTRYPALNWLQLGGTSARVVFGYCLGGRILSLLPWNRREPLSLSLLWRTFYFRSCTT
jgi:hypothetical protein